MKISIIIPTLNAAAHLQTCLCSIISAKSTGLEIEMIVVDGGSEDSTRAIAKRLGAIVLDNPQRIQHTATPTGLRHATGEFICLMDADNELSHPDYLCEACRALNYYKDAFAVEAYYPAAPGMNNFCIYLTELLHIGDPVCRAMTAKPKMISRDQLGAELWTFGKSRAYPMGANGFVYRRADLGRWHEANALEDTAMALEVAERTGRDKWLRIRSLDGSKMGIHHYTATGLKDFYQKRRRVGYHYMTAGRSPVHGANPTWDRAGKPAMPQWLAMIVCVTVIVPLIQGIWKALRARDARWLWHPVAAFASVCGLMAGIWTFSAKRKPEHKLQPRASLATIKS